MILVSEVREGAEHISYSVSTKYKEVSDSAANFAVSHHTYSGGCKQVLRCRGRKRRGSFCWSGKLSACLGIFK